MFKIHIAHFAGYCMGVRRAINTVFDSVNRNRKWQIFTYGPLIHNDQVTSLLKSKGVRLLRGIGDLDQVTSNDLVVIRTHGVTPVIRQHIAATGAKIVNATCSKVASVQSTIRRFARKGYYIVIIGDAGHAEVDGLMGFTGGNGTVINSCAQADAITAAHKRICVVAQTTQETAIFTKIATYIEEHGQDVLVYNTICNATELKQTEIHRMAQDCDVMVVVGSKHSANTTRLADISSNTGTKTIHVATAAELQAADFAAAKQVGVTAGASTPNWVLQEVVDRLNGFRWESSPPAIRSLASAINYLVKSYLYLAIAAYALGWSIMIVCGQPVSHTALLVAALYIFSMHNLNQFTDKDAAQFNSPAKLDFYKQHTRPLIIMGLGAALAGLLASLFLSESAFFVVLLASILGILYQLPLLPKSFNRRSLKEAPASKDILLAGAWALVTVVVPALARKTPSNSNDLWAFLIVYSLVLARSIFGGVQEVSGDRIAGKHTIPIFMGEKKALELLELSAQACAALLLVLVITGWLPQLFLFFFPAYLWVLCYIHLYRQNLLTKHNLYELVLDTTLVLPALLLLLSKIFI